MKSVRVDAKALVPAKAQAIPLAADCQTLTSFRKIAFSCLEHLEGNLAGALNGDDPEFIHQMRVSTRRLRAAIRLFAPHLPPDFSDKLLPPLRQLMDHLGKVRDLDVLLAEIAMPVVHALPDEPGLAALVKVVTKREHEARKAASRYLRSASYVRLILLATELLHHPSFVERATEETIASFATDRLKQLRKKVLKLAKAARTDDPASLHRLRIGIKRLRYALEFFGVLFHSGKTLRRLLSQLGALQNDLGQLNDLANASLLLMRCTNDDARLREVVSLVDDWYNSRRRKLLARVPERLEKFQRLHLPTLN
ncbi:MAG: CHAD domain-containing protein [Betaproteobacteria bacterium]|nr:CHAD domain-containing protein [Betaproteobacteria bacterium]